MENKALVTINKIRTVIHTAERWSDEQLMPEGQICMAALKDIRRMVKECLDE